MKKIKISTDYLFLGLIIFLGAFLRLYQIRDYIVFLGDEGRDVLVVWGILHGDLTLLGPTASVGGFFLGPIYYYLMTPFLWLSKYDPVGPAIMVVLFGLATIFLVYKIGKEFFGNIAGLIAALFYAISPIVIIYSRSSWNPNVFPFFTLASLYTLYKAVEKNKWWLFALAGFLMGLNLQIHYLATFVGAIMFFYVLFADFKKNMDWFKNLIKRYLLMFLGFMVGFSPFLAFELRHDFKNSYNIINFIFKSQETGAGLQIFSNAAHVFTRLYGGLMLNFPLTSNFDKFNDRLIPVWLITSILLGLISIGFFVYKFYKNIHDKKNYRKYLLVFLWGLIGIGLFMLYKREIYDYYLGFLFPLPFLLIGFLLSSVKEKYKKFGGIAVLFLVILLIAVNIKHTPIGIPGNKQLSQVKEISNFVLDKTNGEPFNFALMSIGNSDHAYRYFFRLAGKDPVTIENWDIDPNRNTTTNQLLVICEKSIPCKPLGYGSWEVSGFGRAEVVEEWDVNYVKVFKLKHYGGVKSNVNEVTH